MLKLIARILARPAVVDWLIRRAKRRPYLHLDGYMQRYWLFNPHPARSDEDMRPAPWRWLPSVRLHRILRRDVEPHMHDHPWNARTFILRGWYYECRPIGNVDPKQARLVIRRCAGDTATLRFGEYHHIDRVSPGGVWTLFITWRKKGGWGFLVDGRKVNWREYLGISK
jgi:hypothetical protein